MTFGCFFKDRSRIRKPKMKRIRNTDFKKAYPRYLNQLIPGHLLSDASSSQVVVKKLLTLLQLMSDAIALALCTQIFMIQIIPPLVQNETNNS